MTVHTRGPWRLTGEQTKNSETIIRGPPKTDPNQVNLAGEPVAYAADFNRFDRDGEREANARLIAAAPELLAALIALRKKIAMWPGEKNPETFQEVKGADVAIAKAKGEQHD